MGLVSTLKSMEVLIRCHRHHCIFGGLTITF